MLDKIGFRDTQSDPFKLVYKLKEEVIDYNITVFIKFDLEVQNDSNTLPIMHWLPKMHKTLTRASFMLHLEIIAQRLCQMQLQKFLNKILSKLKGSVENHFFTLITKSFG